MGAFDILTVSARCPGCGSVMDQKYQFKYGSPWQREYVLGDELMWEGNSRRWNGSPLPGLIAVDAEIEPCTNCGYTYEFSIIYMDQGRFIGAGSNMGRFQFSETEYALPIEKYVFADTPSGV